MRRAIFKRAFSGTVFEKLHFRVIHEVQQHPQTLVEPVYNKDVRPYGLLNSKAITNDRTKQHVRCGICGSTKWKSTGQKQKVEEIRASASGQRHMDCRGHFARDTGVIKWTLTVHITKGPSMCQDQRNADCSKSMGTMTT